MRRLPTFFGHSLPRVGRCGIALIVAAAACACTKKTPAKAPPPSAGGDDLVVKIVHSYPHDRTAFTQGLLFYGGDLYESTGLEGQSTLRRVDPDSGKVESQITLEAPLFGEGLARIGSELLQLTWKNGRAFVWDLNGFQRVSEHSYRGEGWGLCYDGRRLIMSDGSERLTFRDPKTFAETGSVRVMRMGSAVMKLNELECVDGLVYANIWGAEQVARIDPSTGQVTGWIDATGLLSRDERVGVDVLNGIAYHPERGTFFLTGKLWPRMFEVQFVPRVAGYSTSQTNP